MGLSRRRMRLSAAFAALAATALLAACAAPAEDPDAKEASASASEPTGPIPTDAVDPDRAVEAPGAFDGVQYGDDLLLVSQETIPDDVMKQILGVKVRGKVGVAAHERLSYGQFSIENKVLNIAAINPRTYRAFTGTQSAEFQDQWDRIAGGEMAISQGLQRDVPVNDDGYLDVGKSTIHVGAWSPAEVDGVDAMVNARWGAELGLPDGNAVLLNTGITSPQAVREVIEKEFGKKRFSITALDIVAQAGIDLDTFQNVIPVGAFKDAVGTFRYRPIGGGRIAPEASWVKAYITTEAVPILGTVTCNRYMMPQLKAALQEVVRSGLADKIHKNEYAGCYYPRFIAGSSSLSNHSFGLALDFNVPGNQRGTVGEMDRSVVAIFKRWGFAWGGDWSFTDPMHFELARIVNPG